MRRKVQQCGISGIRGRQLRPERDPCGARECGEIDEQIRLLAVRFGERIGEDQAPFRIRVADLHRDAFARLDDVARAVGMSVDTVLDRGINTAAGSAPAAP